MGYAQFTIKVSFAALDKNNFVVYYKFLSNGVCHTYANRELLLGENEASAEKAAKDYVCVLFWEIRPWPETAETVIDGFV